MQRVRLGEQFGAVRSSPLKSLNRSLSLSEVSGSRSETRPLRQHSVSLTRYENGREQTPISKIPRYLAAALRGMRNRSERCSARGRASGRNGELLFGLLGASTDEVSTQCGGQHGCVLPQT